MHLVPTQDEVVGLLRHTGAIREGHFEYPNGLHATEYMQVQLAMRYFQHAKVLSVGLSRLLRANAEIRAMIPELSIVSPDTGGLPVAYGVCEALRAHQVYWADRREERGPMAFRQFLEQKPGEKVLLVDDILRSANQPPASCSRTLKIVTRATRSTEPWTTPLCSFTRRCSRSRNKRER